MTEIQEARRRLEAAGVQYVFGAYTDLNGVPKSKCVPLAHFEDMAAGSELYTVGALEGMGELGPNEDECVGDPRPGQPHRAALGHPLRAGRRRTCTSTASPTATTPAGSCAARWTRRPPWATAQHGRRARGVRAAPGRGPLAAVRRPGPRQRADPGLRPGGDHAGRCVPRPDGRLPGRARLGRLLLRPRGRRRPVRVRLRLHRRPGHGRPHGGVPAAGQARRPLAGLHRHLHAQAVAGGVRVGAHST